MFNAQRIIGNFKWLVVSQAVIILAGFLLSILIPRYLGIVGFGKFSFAVSFSLIFASFADMGLNKLIIREVARDRSGTGKLFANAIVLKILLSILIYVGMLVTVNFLDYTIDAKNIIYVMCLQSILVMLASGMRGVFQAYEKMNYEAIVILIEKALIVLFVIIAMMMSKGIVAISLGYLAGTIISAIISAHLVRRLSSGQLWTVESSSIKRVFVMAIPFFFVYVSSAINLRVDTVMLNMILGHAVTGLYAVAQQSVLQLFLLSSLFTASVFPSMSRLAKTHESHLRVMYCSGMKYLLIAGLPIVVGTALLQDKIVRLFYGQEFVGSAPILGLLVWLIVPYFLSTMLTNLLIAIDKQHVSSYSIGAGAVLNVFLNLLLIPRFGVFGAGIATIVTQSLIFIIQYWVSIRAGFVWNLFQWKPLLSVGIMGVFVYFLREFNIGIVVISAAILYIAVLLLLRTFSLEERSLLAQVFTRKNSLVSE